METLDLGCDLGFLVDHAVGGFLFHRGTWLISPCRRRRFCQSIHSAEDEFDRPPSSTPSSSGPFSPGRAAKAGPMSAQLRGRARRADATRAARSAFPHVIATSRSPTRAVLLKRQQDSVHPRCFPHDRALTLAHGGSRALEDFMSQQATDVTHRLPVPGQVCPAGFGICG
jgi:hypothetical protein